MMPFQDPILDIMDPLPIFKKSRVLILVASFSLSSHKYGHSTGQRQYLRQSGKAMKSWPAVKDTHINTRLIYAPDTPP